MVSSGFETYLRTTPLALIAIAATFTACVDHSSFETTHIDVQFVSEVVSVAPGQPFWVGLVQTVDSGWHTYWRNPGDSGAATRINIDLPNGWSKSPIQWPYPERMPFGTLVNYGYTGQVLLPIQITPPDVLDSGKIKLTAEVLWIVCADVCIPGEAELTLRLPVRSQPGEPDLKIAPLFDLSRTQLPTEASGISHAERRDGYIAITVQFPDPVDWDQIWYFPHIDNTVVHAADQQHSITASGAVELLVKSGPVVTARVNGTVVFGSGDSARSYILDIPVTEVSTAHD